MPRRRFRSLRRRMRPATGSPTMGANETGRLAGEREDAVPSARDRNYAMALLFAAMVLDYADRQVVSVLLPAFKQSLQLSLVQASIVSGLAFSLFFAFAGIPLGRIADRSNRRNLVAAGTALWSLATVGCGLSNSFWTLFASRMAVGVGEACLMPALASLLADYYAPDQRGRAVNFVQTGAPLGALVAMIGGGWLLTWFDTSGILVRLGAPLESWQAVFLTLGGPGVIVALLFLAMKEPPRREPATSSDHDGSGFLHTVRRHPGAFVGIFGLQTLVTMASYAVLTWAPTIFITAYGKSAGEAGTILGLMLVVCGIGAYLVSGFTSDVLMRWRPRYGRVFMPGVILPIGVAGFAGLYFSRDLATSTVLLAVGLFIAALAAGSAVPSLQAIVPGRQRGMAIATLTMATTFVGLGLAPIIVAFGADVTGAMEGGLQQSLAAVCVTVLVAALGLWPFLIRSYAGARNYEAEEFADQPRGDPTPAGAAASGPTVDHHPRLAGAADGDGA